MKLPEGSRQRLSFFQKAEGSEGRPSFGRKPKDGNKFIKPKDALFSKQVGFLRKAARGEASRRTFRKPKDALFSKQVHQAARGEASFRNKFIKPPEVKLLSESECDPWSHCVLFKMRVSLLRIAASG